MNLAVSSMGILAKLVFPSSNMIYFSIYLWHFQCLSSSLTVFRLQFIHFLGNIILIYLILFSAIINRIVLLISPVNLLLVYRNSSNFMLIFLYLYWIHLFVLIVFFFFWWNLWRRQWHPTPVLLPGKSMDRGAGRLQSMGLLRVGHDWATSLSLFSFMHWRRKWQPTPVFLPGESQGRWSLVGCRLWGHTESDTTDAT